MDNSCINIVPIPIWIDRKELPTAADIVRILSVIRPEWNHGNQWIDMIELAWKPYQTLPKDVKHKIRVSIMYKGLHNTLFKIQPRHPEIDALVLRVYDGTSDHTVQHDLEYLLVQHLQRFSYARCFMHVYCRLINGYVYQHVEGEYVFSDEETDERMIEKICTEMHALHAIPPPPEIFNPTIRQVDTNLYVMSTVFDRIKQEDRGLDESLQSAGLNRSMLYDLYHQAMCQYRALINKFKPVICHMDMNYHNIVRVECNGFVIVRLIDFERLSLGPEIMDLAMMCTCSIDIGDGVVQHRPRLPISKSDLLDRWIRIYLKTHPNNFNVTDDLVTFWKTGIATADHFIQAMNVFICVSHFLTSRDHVYLHRAAKIHACILQGQL